MCVACGVNTSSVDVFEIGVPNYQLTEGMEQTESWGGEQAVQCVDLLLKTDVLLVVVCMSIAMALFDLVLFLMSLNLPSKVWHLRWSSSICLFLEFVCRSQILYLFVLLSVDKK